MDSDAFRSLVKQNNTLQRIVLQNQNTKFMHALLRSKEHKCWHHQYHKQTVVLYKVLKQVDKLMDSKDTSIKHRSSYKVLKQVGKLMDLNDTSIKSGV